jgi:hypothetical protein
MAVRAARTHRRTKGNTMGMWTGWLTSKASRRNDKPQRAQPDPADMGTAFGLDASMASDDDADAPHGSLGGVPGMFAPPGQRRGTD